MIHFPPKPDFSPLVTNDEREKIFGHFDFKPDPLPDNKEHIKILGGWDTDNIVWVPIPQLTIHNDDQEKLYDPLSLYTVPDGMWFHRLAAQQLQDMFAAWEQADLISLILTFSGSFVPRFVRGGTHLSNHAFGSAFDINYEWNMLGDKPAQVKEKGSVRKLVPIANMFGFFWGGHYNSRLDGMHFEVAKLITPPEEK